MNNPIKRYISIEHDFFQDLEKEIGRIFRRLVNFERTLETVRPTRIISSPVK
jgi:hypothetical protein